MISGEAGSGVSGAWVPGKGEAGEETQGRGRQGRITLSSWAGRPGNGLWWRFSVQDSGPALLLGSLLRRRVGWITAKCS